MTQRVFFMQECPTCGRNLQVRVEYLGRLVACQHCHGSFISTDPATGGGRYATSTTLLRRANELLDLVESRRAATAMS